MVEQHKVPNIECYSAEEILLQNLALHPWLKDEGLLEGYRESIIYEWEETERAVKAITESDGSISGSGKWIWKTKKTDASRCIEVCGVPNTAKTLSLREIHERDPDFINVFAEPDLIAKQTLLGIKELLGADYDFHLKRYLRHQEGISAAMKFAMYKAKAPVSDKYNLFDRSLFDQIFVWHRTGILDGNLVIPRVNDYGKPHYRTGFVDITEAVGGSWNIIICISSVNSILEREFEECWPILDQINFDSIHNPRTMAILRLQYLRLYYECMISDFPINVVLLDVDKLSIEETTNLIQSKIQELKSFSQ